MQAAKDSTVFAPRPGSGLNGGGDPATAGGGESNVDLSSFRGIPRGPYKNILSGHRGSVTSVAVHPSNIYIYIYIYISTTTNIVFKRFIIYNFYPLYHLSYLSLYVKYTLLLPPPRKMRLLKYGITKRLNMKEHLKVTNN